MVGLCSFISNDNYTRYEFFPDKNIRIRSKDIDYSLSDMAIRSKSLQVNGYISMLNGLKIQWIAGIYTDTVKLMAYPISFTNTPFCSQTTPFTASDNTGIIPAIMNTSINTYFQAKHSTNRNATLSFLFIGV